MAKMKFGNGTGSVTKLKGNRRKPYLVRANAFYSISKKGDLKENRKIIGTAATKEEAYKMLLDYLQNPYNLDKTKTTFKEVYEQWYPSYFQGVSKSTQSFYKTAFSYCSAIYNRPIRDLRTIDYQNMFDQAVDRKGKPLSQDALKRVKLFLGVLNRYAIQQEIITKDYSEFTDIRRYKDRESKKIDHDVFTEKEIIRLWAKQSDKVAQIILCMIYTGCRVKKEFFNIKKKDVDLEEHFIHITESKTKNGIRWIPIPDIIYPIVCSWYNDGESEYLFHSEYDSQIDYSWFRQRFWDSFMKENGMEHTPYDCRHTYNSMLANLEVNVDIREKLMGHSTGNVNIDVYTHLQKQKLLEIVNRLQVKTDRPSDQQKMS